MIYHGRYYYIPISKLDSPDRATIQATARNMVLLGFIPYFSFKSSPGPVCHYLVD